MRCKKLLPLLGIIGLSIMLVVMSFTPSTPSGEWPKELYVASLPKGTLSYPPMVALAKLITKYTPSRGIIREYMPPAAFDAVSKGTADLFGMGQYECEQAYFAYGMFEKMQPAEIRLINFYWPFWFAFGVRPNEGIDSVPDLTGKRVMTKSPSVVGNDCCSAFLEYYGILNKIKPIQVSGIGEPHVTYMVDRMADGFFLTVGGGYTLQIKQSVGLKWLPVSRKAIEFVCSRVLGTSVQPWADHLKKMYNIPLSEEVLGVSPAFSILGRTSLPDHVIYGILDALYATGHLNEVKDMSAEMQLVSLELASSYFCIPMHPGAIKYYKDKGVWTEEKDRLQQELLAKTKAKRRSLKP